MPYSIQLLLDNLVFQTVRGDYTIAELTKASQEMAGIIDSSNQPCYLIADLSKMRSIETNLVQVRNATQPLLSHPNLKVLVGYGSSDNTIVNFMGTIMANLFKIPLKILRNQEEAIAFLISQDASLNGKLQAALQKINQQTV